MRLWLVVLCGSQLGCMSAQDRRLEDQRRAVMLGNRQATSKQRASSMARPHPGDDDRAPLQGDRTRELEEHRARRVAEPLAREALRDEEPPVASQCAILLSRCPLLGRRWQVRQSASTVTLSAAVTPTQARRITAAVRCHLQRDTRQGRDPSCLERLDASAISARYQRGGLSLQLTAGARGASALRRAVAELIDDEADPP